MRCVRTLDWYNEYRARAKFKFTIKYIGKRKSKMFRRVKSKSNHTINDAMWESQRFLENEYEGRDPEIDNIMREWGLEWN